MDIRQLSDLLKGVAAGAVAPEAALERLRALPFEDVGCAKYDSHRSLRTGFSEVIYCGHKTTEDVVAITRAMLARGCNVFGTRACAEIAEALAREIAAVRYDAVSRTFSVITADVPILQGTIAIACGGTADIPVAEEARQTARFFGCEANTFYDVGVAGIHRLFAHIKDLREADVVIAVAGMEGALASVIGGMIDRPVIAVPTSVGYGAHLGGLTTLFAMLNSCSEGIAVMNIDNGFGAACAAVRIIRAAHAADASGENTP